MKERETYFDPKRFSCLKCSRNPFVDLLMSLSKAGHRKTVQQIYANDTHSISLSPHKVIIHAQPLTVKLLTICHQQWWESHLHIPNSKYAQINITTKKSTKMASAQTISTGL